MTDLEIIDQAIARSKERENGAPRLPPIFPDWDEESTRIAYLNGGVARAVYGLQCRYVGPHHEEASIRFIEDAIRAARMEELKFRDALVVAVSEFRDIGGPEGAEAISRIAAVLRFVDV